MSFFTEPGDPMPLFTLATIAADYQLELIAEQWERMTEQERRAWMEFHSTAGQISDPDAFLVRLLRGATGTAFYCTIRGGIEGAKPVNRHLHLPPSARVGRARGKIGKGKSGERDR